MTGLGAMQPAPYPFPQPEQGQGCRYLVEHVPFGTPTAPPTQSVIAVTRSPDAAVDEQHLRLAEGYIAWWARWHAEKPGVWQVRRTCVGRDDAVIDNWTVGDPPSYASYIAAIAALAIGGLAGWLLRGRRP